MHACMYIIFGFKFKTYIYTNQNIYKWHYVYTMYYKIHTQYIYTNQVSVRTYAICVYSTFPIATYDSFISKSPVTILAKAVFEIRVPGTGISGAVLSRSRKVL